MKRLFAGLLAGILLLLVAAALLAFRAIQDEPLVTGDAPVSAEDLSRAKDLIRRNDPRRLKRDELRETRVAARDLETLVNLAVRRGRATVNLEDGAAELRYSAAVPPTPLGRYLNLRTRVVVADDGLEFQKVRVGSIPIPGSVFRAALLYASHHSTLAPDLELLQKTIDQVAITPGELRLRYTWQPELLDSARARALSPDDRERLAAAHKRLVAHMDSVGHGRRQAPLAEVLGPLLQDAGSIDKNLSRNYRDALLVIAFQLSERNIAQLIPEARQWPRPRALTLTLRGREDLAQHFSVSAALAAWAGEPLASAIGLGKEVDDARGGSGFSFADLAADRAGTRLGELAVGNPQRLAAAVSGGLGDAALLPPITGLPESMMSGEFQRRFGGVGAPAYQRMSDEIDRRIAALALFR
ncbi:MAG TPA: hypothetical protein PKZ19_08490 [Zoogloea sp.]|jgi:hypothetical protein|uniref:hypothetical protein n=1 Tax=Zoogloea sp. TaxID=49181 RepID=UPI002D1398E4|nr:hypothetical protein [Zoogloea sp.]